MADRSTVVLYGKFERALFNQARLEGYIKPLKTNSELPDSFILPGHLGGPMENHPDTPAALQQLLLFDNVVLVNDWPWAPYHDYDRLKKTGFFEVLDQANTPSILGNIKWDQSTREYAIFLKSFVLDAIFNKLGFWFTKPTRATRKLLRSYGLTARDVYSIIYDFFFSTSQEAPSKELNNIIKFINARHKGYVSDKAFDELVLSGKPQNMADLGMFSHEMNALLREYNILIGGPHPDYPVELWMADFKMMAGKLMILLELSVTRNAVLTQSEFNLSGVDLGGEVSKRKLGDKFMDSYQILRVSYERLIGTLPKLDSIKQVLQTKEKRARDIRRLRLVINEIEDDLRTGRRQALKKAEKEIRQASYELACGNRNEKLAEWVAYFPVPVCIIEELLHFEPIASLGLGIVGTAAILSAKTAKARNGWLQVVR